MYGGAIIPTFAVVLSWIVMAFGLAAIGICFLDRLTRGMDVTWTNLFCGIWTGFAILTAALMLWHLFLPVNGLSLAVFSVLAGVAFFTSRRWFAKLFLARIDRGFAFVVTGCVLWFANHALGPGGYDDFQYEFQGIRWYHDYPIVPGLANLHPRIGFNNAHHLFGAMLSVGPWRGAVNHLFNGFFLALAVIWTLHALLESLRESHDPPASRLFAALMLAPCTATVFLWPTHSTISTLKADVFICAATVIMACLFLRWSATPRESAESRVLAATLLLLACLMPAVKLSGCVFSLIVGAIVFFRSTIFARPGIRTPGHLILVSGLIGASILLLMSIRGVILTGYPFFPLKAGSWNVDWRVSEAEADLLQRIITISARHPDGLGGERIRRTYAGDIVFKGDRWFGDWVASLVTNDGAAFILPAALLLCLSLAAIAPKRGSLLMTCAFPAWPFASLAAASLASLILWAREAPAVRFGIAYVWILFGAILVWFVRSRRLFSRPPGSSALAAIVLAGSSALAFMLTVLLRPAAGVRPHLLLLTIQVAAWLIAFAAFRRAGVRCFVALCLLPPLFQVGDYLGTGRVKAGKSLLAMHLFPHKLPPFVLSRTCSGLPVYTDSFSDYETPLPNTPFLDPRLRLRGSRLQDGFVLKDCPATVSSASDFFSKSSQ